MVLLPQNLATVAGLLRLGRSGVPIPFQHVDVVRSRRNNNAGGTRFQIQRPARCVLSFIKREIASILQVNAASSPGLRQKPD